MKSKLIIAIIFFLILGWQLYKKYEQTEDILSNYTPVKAEVKRVSPSGIRNQRSTILYVGYAVYNESKLSTIRRSGYTEGAYQIGDTITIYINPNNLEDIR